MYRYQKRPSLSLTSNRIGLSDRKFDVAENGLSRSEMKTSKNESSSGTTKNRVCRIDSKKFNLSFMRQQRQQIRLTPQITIEMWEKQNGKCIYCERTMIARDKWLQPTIEHIIPRSEG